MNDTDDFEMDDLESIDELDEVEDSLVDKKITIKRDVRTEIEKRLEQIELRKIMGDSVYDEVFE